MGTSYNYANYTKRERLACDALGGSSSIHGLGYTLASRAFQLMLVQAGTPGPHALIGRWAGDHIRVIGDNDVFEDSLEFNANFLDLEANAILVVFHVDGIEPLVEAARECDRVYIQMCYLVATRQALELDGPLRENFGPSYLNRYKELSIANLRPAPKDLVVSPLARESS